MGEGANRAARQVNVNKYSLEGVVSVTFAQDKLKIMNVCCDLVCIDVEVSVRLCAKFID